MEINQEAGRLVIGGNTIEWWLGGTTRTTFPDGTALNAHPTGTLDQLQTAQEIGYGGDLASMVREHEIIHTLVAAHMGNPYCPVLYAAAKGEPFPADDMQACWIEGHVLEVQRRLNDPNPNGYSLLDVTARELLRPEAKS